MSTEQRPSPDEATGREWWLPGGPEAGTVAPAGSAAGLLEQQWEQLRWFVLHCDRNMAWLTVDAIVTLDPDLRRPATQSLEDAIYFRAIMALRLLQFALAERLFAEALAGGGPLAGPALRQILQLRRMRGVLMECERRGIASTNLISLYGVVLGGAGQIPVSFTYEPYLVQAPLRADVQIDGGELEPAAHATVVRRTPHMDLSVEEPLTPGAEFRATVYADLSGPHEFEVSEPLTVVMPEGVDRVEVEVWLNGTAHFDIDEAGVQTLVLERDRQRSTDAAFNLRVRPDAPETPASLTAYFFHKGRPCGLVSRAIRILLGTKETQLDSEIGEPPPTATIEPDVSADAPDLTVTITWPDRNQHRYWCRVTSRHLPPEEQSSEEWLPGDLENLIDSKLGEFVDPRVDEYGRMTSLTGAGLEFFDASPDNFKRIFWELIDRRTPPRTIYIVTQEPSLPWELMIPNREGADGYEQREPLGVEFAVGRRITQSHRSAPQHLPLKTSWVIAPRYSGNPPQLPHAEVEAQDVASRFHGMRVDPADVKRINLMLQAEPRSLVHVVCHGARGQRAGTQEIYVDGNDRVLTSTMARGMQGFRVQCQNKAVFFLNACEVGQPVPALVGAGGFARVFSEFGAGAVIAPLWSVDDAVAHEVATRFYDEIAGGADRSFAEILRDIRRQAYNETGVDTYAAYCFYGDPLARA